MDSMMVRAWSMCAGVMVPERARNGRRIAAVSRGLLWAPGIMLSRRSLGV